MRSELFKILSSQLSEQHKILCNDINNKCSLLERTMTIHQKSLIAATAILKLQCNITSNQMILDIVDNLDLPSWIQSKISENGSNYSHPVKENTFAQIKRELSERELLRQEENRRILKLIEIKTKSLIKLIAITTNGDEKRQLIHVIQAIPYPILLSFKNDDYLSDSSTLSSSLPENEKGQEAQNLYYNLSKIIEKSIQKKLDLENQIKVLGFLIEDTYRYIENYQFEEAKSPQFNLLYDYVCVTEAASKVSIQKTQHNSKSKNEILLEECTSIMPIIGKLADPFDYLTRITEGTEFESVSFCECILDNFLKDMQSQKLDTSKNLNEGSLSTTIALSMRFGVFSGSAPIHDTTTLNNLIVNRHRSPEDQKNYDQIYGIIHTPGL